jgi:YVTN family beta-propeller protein
VVATIPVGDALSLRFHWTSLADSFFSDPVHVAIAPDGARAYMTNAGSHNVSLIDTATYAVTAKVQVGRTPFDAGSNSVSVIDASTNAVTATVPVGVLPVNAAVF